MDRTLQKTFSPTRIRAVSESAKNSADNRLLIIDGHSMAFRAFYALPAENFRTATGQHTNAVYGFLTMLLTMIRQQKPTHIAVAFDLSTPTFRSEEYAEYKAGRAEIPQEFHGQIELIEKVMEALNIPTLTLDGYEADDIVATLATQAEDAGWQARVVSGDRDTFQLITDAVTVLYPMRGVSDIPPMDADAVVERYKVTPAQYPDMAALVGEDADNLPGVPGVGPGFAAKWLTTYGDLDGVIENADQIKGKKGEALREHLDDVRRNRRLNALVRDLDLPLDLAATELRTPDREELEELFDALEFNRVRERVFDTYAERLGVEADTAVDTAPETTIITTSDQFDEFISTNAGQLFGVHLHLDPPPTVTRRKIPAPGQYGNVLSIGLATDDAAAAVDLTTADDSLWDKATEFLSDPAFNKALYDLKAGLKALVTGSALKTSVRDAIQGVSDDVVLSAYILQPDRRSYELKDLVQSYLNTKLELIETKSSSGQGELDLEGTGGLGDEVVSQSGRAAWMIRQLSTDFTPEVMNRGAQTLLTDLEIPLAVVLAEMEIAGIGVDRKRLDELQAEFTSQVTDAQESAWVSIGGTEVNLGSPKQLQVVLFDTLGLPKTRKTKTGYSTDADSLNDLLEKTDHPFLHNLMKYRDWTKLNQTVQGLLDSIADDGRIHTRFSQTAAATGRLSSLNPNLQNIPVRTAAGRQIRDIFVADQIPGHDGQATLITADYSQIEMRIMAHLSQDEGLIKAYQDGEDLHRFVGSQVFDVAPEDVTSSMRDKVKAMSYGLAYGLSSFGLSKQLRISVDEARELMSTYFDRFGAVRVYLREVVKQARRDGFTSTMLGRRRYLPDLSSDNRQLRDMAERAALNAPIQGSAADLIKVAMLGVQNKLREENLVSRMILQVHDELILEVATNEAERAEEILVSEMSNAAELRVPLEVQVGHGHSWHSAAH